MLTSGGLPEAFWTTRNVLVMSSMTWPVCRTKSPFLLPITEDVDAVDSAWNKQPRRFAELHDSGECNCNSIGPQQHPRKMQSLN